MQFVTPTIINIASTVVKTDDIDYMLEELGVEEDAWNTDAEGDGDALTEIAGRFCYKSFGVGLNPNVTKVREGNKPYIDNVLKSQHGSTLEHTSDTFAILNVSRVFCYHPDTEILTKEGWKQITSIKDNEILLTMNPKTRKARWSPNKKLHSFDYIGKLTYWENSQGVTPMVTPDHLMWVAKYDVRTGEKWEKVPVNKINVARMYVDNSINMESAIHKEEIKIGKFKYNSKDLFTWLGLVATDGSINEKIQRVTINQSKPKVCKIIWSLMKRLFGDRARDSVTDEGYHTYYVCDEKLAAWVVKHIGRIKSEREMSLMLTYSKDILSWFFKGAMLGDGNVHAKNGHRVLYCCNRSGTIQWQAIAAMIGFSSNVREDETRVGQERVMTGTGAVIRHNYSSWILSLHKKNKSLLRKSMMQDIKYKGKVYCPQTKDGLVFVRNKGQAMWCGNTHEIVRHRLASFSQESLRYVRLDNLSAYYPKVFEDIEDPEVNAKVREIFIRGFEQAEANIKELTQVLGIEKMKDFNAKKKLTSAMRRIAPDGLATGIIITANQRSWRHMIALRTNSSAEEEIRLVFGEIARTLADKYPAMYQDMNAKIGDFDIPEYSFEYGRV